MEPEPRSSTFSPLGWDSRATKRQALEFRLGVLPAAGLFFSISRPSRTEPPEVNFLPSSLANGSETLLEGAVEGAVKMAYKFHNGARSKILHADISFHGKLLGAAGLTGSPELHFKFPTISGSHSFKYDIIFQTI